MSEKQEYKHIREVFRDFSSSNQNIMNAQIKAMNLFKKTNTLEITLTSDTHIEVKGIYAFEKYLEVRFGIANIKIKIERIPQENPPRRLRMIYGFSSTKAQKNIYHAAVAIKKIVKEEICLFHQK